MVVDVDFFFVWIRIHSLYQKDLDPAVTLIIGIPDLVGNFDKVLDV